MTELAHSKPRVVLGLSPQAERKVEVLLYDGEVPFELVATTLEAQELIRAVEVRQPDAVLVSHDFSGLALAHWDQVRAAGARLVGLAVDAREKPALDSIGVEAILDPGASRQELLAALTGASPTPVPEAAPAPRRERAEDDGSVLAVIGAKGAPGASECAASLAALAADRWETLLLEVDALGGGLALRLGADPSEGSILGLIRATQAGEGSLKELLERWRCQREGWPDVLLGAPDSAALADQQPGALTNALAALTPEYPLVVCDVGFLLDARQPLARLHREVLVSADAVVLVLGASEVQLRDGLRQLDVILEIVDPDQLRLIVNGFAGPSAASRDAIEATITAHLGRADAVDAWLPWDTRGAQHANNRGLPIAAAHRRSRYTKALSGLLDSMFEPTPSPSARRRRRLPVPEALRRSQPPAPAQQYEEAEVALPWQT
jgi:MinD-like ATPase involved in chromosome partitioning or flagellar assembly